MPDGSKITIGTFNYEHGGWSHDGRLHLQPAIDHLAEELPDLDILCFQEAKHYQRDGRTSLYQFAELLHQRLGGLWYPHLALNPLGPLHNAVFVRQETARPIQAWSDPRDPDVGHTSAGSIWLRVDGLSRPLGVMSVHWRHYSGMMRAVEASMLCNLIAAPTIIAGDFNCLWPGERELRPDWESLPPHLRGHKTQADQITGELTTDLDAGRICLRQGWMDAGALADDPTPTTTAPSDRAPCRIDRIMVSPMLAAGIDATSYRVHIPKTPLSDHLLVSVTIDLERFDQPFHAPWWGEAAFGGWTHGGGDPTGANPNTFHGWRRDEPDGPIAATATGHEEPGRRR
jgi:endonuclease/exonuclease/phosphatase family metal-dependent hydrolase